MKRRGGGCRSSCTSRFPALPPAARCSIACWVRPEHCLFDWYLDAQKLLSGLDHVNKVTGPVQAKQTIRCCEHEAFAARQRMAP